MKPAEAVSSSGLGTIRPDRQILNKPQQFLQLPKEKKIIPRRSIASNCPYTLTLCYGGGWGTALAVAATCVPTALAVAATCVRRRGARHQGQIDLRAGRRETPTTRVTATSM